LPTSTSSVTAISRDALTLRVPAGSRTMTLTMEVSGGPPGGKVMIVSLLVSRTCRRLGFRSSE